MKNFKDYESNAQMPKMDSAKRAGEQENISADELIQRLARTYNGKSNGNMLAQILKEAEKSKRAGTLTNQEIDVFYNQFSPMLSHTQRGMLKRVVDKLKEI